MGNGTRECEQNGQFLAMGVCGGVSARDGGEAGAECGAACEGIEVAGGGGSGEEEVGWY